MASEVLQAMLWAVKAHASTVPPTLLHGRMLEWYLTAPKEFMRTLTRYDQIRMTAKPKVPERQKADTVGAEGDEESGLAILEGLGEVGDGNSGDPGEVGGD